MPLLENIQYLCEEIGMSIPKLEQALGFGKGSIYKWAKSSPTIDKLEKVANYLKVSVDYLLDRGDIFDLGPYIQEERESQGFSEKELSDQIGISEFELSQYEDSIIPLTEELLSKIMSVFGMSFPEFLDKYGLFDMEIPSHFDGDIDKFLAFKKAVDEDAMSEPRPDDIQTIAAHHDGEEWTEEELAEIERFKEFVRAKKQQK